MTRAAKPRASAPTLVKDPPANDAAEQLARAVTRAELAHARIVDVFEHRLRAALAYGFDVARHGVTAIVASDETNAYDPRNDPGAVEAMAERLASHLEAVVDAYGITPRRVRPAVCWRLAEHWPLDEIPTRTDSRGFEVPAHVAVPYTEIGVDGYPSRREYFAAVWELEGHRDAHTMEHIAERAGVITPRMVWPSNVSLDDARSILERSTHPDARVMAESFRDGRWYVAPPNTKGWLGTLRTGAFEPTPDNYAPNPERPGWLRIADPSFWRALGGIFNPRFASLVAWAVKTHAEAHANGAFALPSTGHARAALAHVSTGAKPSAWEKIRLQGRRALLRVRWEGRLKPVQLALTFTNSASDTVLSAVLEELSDDGLLDWLVLHAMADEQGRTGEFRWTWERHRELAEYDQRVREGWKSVDARGMVVRSKDEALRAACARRLWQFTRAELFEEIEGELSKRPVGDGPFLRITAIGDPSGLQPGGDFSVALVALNRTLYAGAHHAAKSPHHTGIPRGVFKLRGPARRLAVFLCIAERTKRDKGMAVTLSESTLMRYAGVRGDGRPSRQHIADARRELQRHLDAVNAVMGDGASGTWREGASGERMYDHTPARWRVERDLLGAAPDRPAPRLDVPRTGADLVLWRERRKLSQREAAEVLGVSKRTITSAEVNAAGVLPRSFRDVDWNARQTPARAKLETRNPSVEGGDAGGDDPDE